MSMIKTAAKAPSSKKTGQLREKIMVRIRSLLLIYLVGLVLFIYIVGLLNPITGPSLQYPYVELYCGRKPVIASDFMTKSYATPNMTTYEPTMYNDKFYCTEQEAQSHGYHKSAAP
jgi:hypothetical protein